MTEVVPHTPTEKQFSRERLEAEKRLDDLIAKLRRAARKRDLQHSASSTRTVIDVRYGQEVSAILDEAEQDTK